MLEASFFKLRLSRPRKDAFSMTGKYSTYRQISTKIRQLADDKRHLPENEVLRCKYFHPMNRLESGL